ncbi:MAG: hypothetical protein OXK80_05100 [Bdellovibrionales bacterium]|nr:hypothetical protein [Bdellovibrionales bacterium]
MKFVLLIFLFAFFAYSAEESSSENSEERVMFTVEDTPKEFFDVEDTKKPDVETAVVSSESSETPKSVEEEAPSVLPEEILVSSEAPKPEEESAVVEETPLAEEELADADPEKEEDFIEPEIKTESADEIAISQVEESVSAETTQKEILDWKLPKPKVDVLIVIDNSGSMKFILRGIGRKMQTFKEVLDLFVDHQIGFLSARVNPNQDKRLMALEYRGRIFTQQTFLNPETDTQVLIDTLVRGKGDKCDKPPYCGGRSERPLGALEAYFFSDHVDHFIREESEGLAVVLITDNEENQKSRVEPATKVEDVLSIFDQRYPDRNFKAYTLTILDTECQTEIRNKQLFFREGNFAPGIVALANWTEGRSFSLCLPSYQEVAEQIVSDFSFNE